MSQPPRASDLSYQVRLGFARYRPVLYDRHRAPTPDARCPIPDSRFPINVNLATPEDRRTSFDDMDDAVRGDDHSDVTEAGVEPATPVLPDRALAPVSVVTERFLRAILTYVPLERIVELHLFSPLRQGGIETGIAVIAADIEVPDAPLVADTTSPLELSLDAPEMTHATDVETGNAITNSTDVATEDALDATDPLSESALDDDSPYADDYVTAPTPASAPAAVSETQAAEPASITQPATHVRHTVYTARYRLVLKGPERGRWEIDVVDEADAPLLAVETVVRGVQRRAGEATDIVRFDAAHIARALRMLTPGAIA